MSAGFYESFDVPEAVNAVGYATRVGGSRPSPEVLEAMRQASLSYVEIDDLQAAASDVIARHTGAEAGLVTSGAAAGLTLAAAACLAGSDPERMDRLPDVSGLERFEIVYPKAGRYDYDHAVRLSGARLVEVDGGVAAFADALGPRTAALGAVYEAGPRAPDVRGLAALAHERGLPFFFDAANALPPPEHLKRFIAEGADLVVFSGGKHLQGPQASGILCGSRDLVRSAWVQMADMDVRPRTWSLRRWVDDGWIARPPRHGIGRSLKVGKETIAGLLAALEAYPKRDFAAERRAWDEIVEAVAGGLASVDGLRVRSVPAEPFPFVELRWERLPELTRELRNARPKVLLREDEEDPGRAVVMPMCLRPNDVSYLVLSIRKAVKNVAGNP
jgi:L-seryl-tRNA(Ser) seleniumtransferase